MQGIKLIHILLVGLFSMRASADTLAATVTPQTLYPVLSPVFHYQKLSNDGGSRVRQLVDQVVESYNSRFNSENQIASGDPRKEAFIQTQSEVMSELKNSAAAVPLFSITNNLLSDLNTQTYLIFDEQRVPIAFAFEYHKYDQITRTYLRVRPLQALSYNNSIQDIEGTPSIVLRGNVSASLGGDVQIICLLDRKHNQYATFPIRLVKEQSGNWSVFYQDAKVTSVQLRLWYDLLRNNGGVRQVTVNSQQSVTLDAY